MTTNLKYEAEQITKELMALAARISKLGDPSRSPDACQAYHAAVKPMLGKARQWLPFVMTMLAELAEDDNIYHPENYRSDVHIDDYLGYQVIHHHKGSNDLPSHPFDGDPAKRKTGWYARWTSYAPAPFYANIVGGQVPFMEWSGPHPTEDAARAAIKNWVPDSLFAKHEVARNARYGAASGAYLQSEPAAPEPKLTDDEKQKLALAKAGLTPPLVIEI